MGEHKAKANHWEEEEMRKKPKTIKLAKIRALIRDAAHWYKNDDGMPGSWTSLNFSSARKCKAKYHNKCNPNKCFYYTRSSRAIVAITIKIYILCTENPSMFTLLRKKFRK